MNKRWLAVVLVGGCLCFSAHAQQHVKTKKNTEMSVELSPVVVTGTGTHQRLKETPAPVAVISAADIKKAGITDFQQAMTMFVPSLSFSTNAMGSYLMMNGLSNKYVLILINGRKLIGDIVNNIDLSRIDMSRVKRIEVLNGAGSSLYGSDAIAGVVNIITDEPRNIMRFSSKSRYETYGQFTEMINADIASDKVGSYTSFKHDQSNGWQNNGNGYSTNKKGNTTEVPTVQPMSLGFHSNLVNQKFTFNPTDKLYLYANGGYYWKLTDRPVTPLGTYGSSDYDLHYEAYNFGLGGRYLLSHRNSISLDLINDNYMQNYKYLRDSKNGSYHTGDYLHIKTQHFYDGELKGIFGFTTNSTTVFGIDYRNETLDKTNAGVKDKSVYTASFYAQHEAKFLNHFNAIVGARYDYHEDAKGRLSPKVALMYTLGNFNFRGTYSAGFRAPGLEELYYFMNKGKTLSVGNVDLKPEHSNYYSLNVEYTSKFLYLSVTGYMNYVTNMISSYINTFKSMPTADVDALKQRAKAEGMSESEIKMLSQAKYYTNADKGTIKGVEVNATANLGAGFSLSGNYAYAYAQNKMNDEWSNVTRSVRNSGTVSGNYTHNWKDYILNLNLNGRFQSRRYHPGDEYGDAPGYGLWNFNVNNTFNGIKHFGLELGMGIDNIFNRYDNRPNGVNFSTLSPGRTAYISLALKFNK